MAKLLLALRWVAMNLTNRASDFQRTGMTGYSTHVGVCIVEIKHVVFNE